MAYTIEDLHVYMAVYQTELHISRLRKDGVEIPSFGSDEWLVNPSRRTELLSMIQGHLVGDESLLQNYITYRKSTDKKLRLIVQIAMRHGAVCFFHNRGLGECSKEFDLDRIIPGSRGGQYVPENCHLVCSHHNRQRGDRSIEDYLVSGSLGHQLLNNGGQA